MTTPAPRWAILDGRRVPHDAATVHASDLGIRRGYAVFEAFRVEQGVPLFLEDHLARFARSADAVGLPLPRGIDGVAADVRDLLDANTAGVTAAHVLLTGGPSDDGITFHHPTCIVTTLNVAPRATVPTGARLITHRHTRQFPEAKSTNYLTAMRLAVARERMPVEERAITLEELHAAAEVLTTGSVRGVVPVTAIDGHPVGDGTVGPHARALFAAFAAHVDGYVAAQRGGVATGA